MVAFARAKAKSIFSKLWFQSISDTKSANCNKNQKTLFLKDKGSNSFLEAIKVGGIWLS